MDLATLIKPILTAGDLRVIGSTTFEEYKHIEKDRALARRLQKIAIDEPSIEETVQDSRRACAAATKSTTASPTPTRRSKPPPSWRRGTCATTGCPTAPSISSTKPAR